jgi:hypothetical protein
LGTVYMELDSDPTFELSWTRPRGSWIWKICQN